MAGATWVYLKKNFDHRANPRTVLAFKAGNHVPATKEAAEAIVAAGAGVLTNHEGQTGDAMDGTQPVRLKGKLHNPATMEEIAVVKDVDVKG
jgi:hypothetical protein